MHGFPYRHLRKKEVTPVKAGVQCLTGSRLSPERRLDTGFRRYDVGGGFSPFYEDTTLKERQ
jgi:hypothetical protein